MDVSPATYMYKIKSTISSRVQSFSGPWVHSHSITRTGTCSTNSSHLLCHGYGGLLVWRTQLSAEAVYSGSPVTRQEETFLGISCDYLQVFTCMLCITSARIFSAIS